MYIYIYIHIYVFTKKKTTHVYVYKLCMFFFLYIYTYIYSYNVCTYIYNVYCCDPNAFACQRARCFACRLACSCCTGRPHVDPDLQRRTLGRPRGKRGAPQIYLPWKGGLWKAKGPPWKALLLHTLPHTSPCVFAAFPFKLTRARGYGKQGLAGRAPVSLSIRPPSLASKAASVASESFLKNAQTGLTHPNVAPFRERA
jgi:hypothetical protein